MLLKEQFSQQMTTFSGSAPISLPNLKKTLSTTKYNKITKIKTTIDLLQSKRMSCTAEGIIKCYIYRILYVHKNITEIS